MSLGKKPPAQGRVVRKDLFRKTLGAELVACVSYGALAVLAFGCAAIIDTDRKQCEVASDCQELGATNEYTCDHNLCNIKHECTGNEQCLTPGKTICAPPGVCVACLLPTDCASPSAMCNAGVCEDPKWGCVNGPDNRPPPTSPTATVTASVPNAVTKEKLPALDVKICRESGVDPGCTIPFPGATGTYDAATGLVTAAGIPNSTLYRLQLAVPLTTPPSNLTRREYVTNRTALGVEMVPDNIGLVPLELLAGLPTPVKIDTEKPFIGVRIFDCQGVLAEGVTLSLSNMPDETRTAYLTDAMALDFAAKATTMTGFGGFINVPAGMPNTITAKLGTYELISFRFLPVANSTMSVDLYPRVFLSQ